MHVVMYLFSMVAQPMCAACRLALDAETLSLIRHVIMTGQRACCVRVLCPAFTWCPASLVVPWRLWLALVLWELLPWTAELKSSVRLGHLERLRHDTLLFVII